MVVVLLRGPTARPSSCSGWCRRGGLGSGRRSWRFGRKDSVLAGVVWSRTAAGKELSGSLPGGERALRGRPPLPTLRCSRRRRGSGSLPWLVPSRGQGDLELWESPSG